MHIEHKILPVRTEGMSQAKAIKSQARKLGTDVIRNSLRRPNLVDTKPPTADMTINEKENADAETKFRATLFRNGHDTSYTVP